jgi:hypothetical protein
MTVANKFSTIGLFNGFPRCIASIDVSLFDYWTTYSGYNKTTIVPPTDLQLRQSQHIAGLMFWNLYAVNATVSIINPAGTITENQLNVHGGNASGVESDTGNNGSDGSFPRPEPEDRVCPGPEFGFVRAVLNTVNGDGDVLILFNPTFVIRMYNGDTSDIDNFVGYGAGVLGPDSSIVTIDSDAGSAATATVSLYGSLDDNVFIGDTAYTEVGGIHFVCFAKFTDAGGVGLGSADAASRTASVTADVGGSTLTASSTINSFEFFTYPD